MHASACLDQRNAVSPGSTYECVLAKRSHGLADKVERKGNNKPPRFLSAVFGGFRTKECW